MMIQSLITEQRSSLLLKRAPTTGMVVVEVANAEATAMARFWKSMASKRSNYLSRAYRSK